MILSVKIWDQPIFTAAWELFLKKWSPCPVKQCRSRSECSWRSCLTRVYTVSIFWTHWCMIKPHCYNFRINEPIVTKPTKWHVRPAKTRISLGIRPVWSESSLSAWRKILSYTLSAQQDSDQTGWMSRLISLHWAHMPFCRFCHNAAQMCVCVCIWV